MHDLPGFGVWISGGVDEAGELLVRGLVLSDQVALDLVISGHDGVFAIPTGEVQPWTSPTDK